MKELKFIEGDLPKGFKLDFESFLFNEEKHRALQAETGWHSFHLVAESEKRSRAAIHFQVTNQIARSPIKAPFGSVEFSKKLKPKDLYDFLKQVESRLKDQGIHKIHIKNPPEAYQPHSSALLEVLLLNLGYRIQQAEIGAVITIDASKYDSKVETWELRKLRQGVKAKLKFKELEVSAIDEVYHFIDACRNERKQSLSMPVSELRNTIESFPEKFVLFGIQQGDELAAASIAIRVSKRILYNFYSAHPRKFDNLSPVVSLISGMYRWSQKQKLELIDLGTSALEGQPNFGLLDFKLRLSGNPTTKFTFEKDL